jgi:hypothetical protein
MINPNKSHKFSGRVIKVEGTHYYDSVVVELENGYTLEAYGSAKGERAGRFKVGDNVYGFASYRITKESYVIDRLCKRRG